MLFFFFLSESNLFVKVKICDKGWKLFKTKTHFFFLSASSTVSKIIFSHCEISLQKQYGLPSIVCFNGTISTIISKKMRMHWLGRMARDLEIKKISLSNSSANSQRRETSASIAWSFDSDRLCEILKYEEKEEIHSLSFESLASWFILDDDTSMFVDNLNSGEISLENSQRLSSRTCS